MKKVILYTKIDCGLCDQAYKILLNLTYDMPLQIEMVDITRDDQIFLKYMERIPVLSTPHSDTELNWPFSAEGVKNYLDTSEMDKD